MADVFKKWAQGDEFAPSAAQLNAWTDAARMVQQGLNQTSPVLGTPEQYFTRLRMRNNTGEVIPQLGIIGYSSPMITPATNEEQFIYDLTVNAIKPAAPLDRFAITLSQVEIGAVFDAAVGGVLPCKVTGSGSKVEAITDDMAKLQAGTTGLELIWSESGSSTRFGVVKLFGAGGETCTPKYQMIVYYFPTGGSFVLRVRAKDGSGTWQTEDKTINYNATPAAVATAIESHTYIASGTVTVSGAGAFPFNSMTIVMPADSELGDGSTSIVSTSLTRASSYDPFPKVLLTECCA